MAYSYAHVLKGQQIRGELRLVTFFSRRCLVQRNKLVAGLSETKSGVAVTGFQPLPRYVALHPGYARCA